MSQQRSVTGLFVSTLHGQQSGWRFLAVILAGIVATSVLLTVTPTPALAATWAVTTTADVAPDDLTLRQAIQQANDTPGADVITFDIPGAGPHVITPATPLPAITDPLIIDGAGELIGSAPGVVLDGSAAGAETDGLLFQVPDGSSAVRSLAITGFGSNGIAINSATGADEITIGGTSVGEGNTITGNGGAGIRITGSDGAAGVSIYRNHIDDNGGLGIDLGANGVDPNDADDADSGANGLQNFPVITTAEPSDIGGTLIAEEGASYRIEVYANDSCDPSGNGEGATFVWFVDVDASGEWGMDQAAYNGTFLTATATRIQGEGVGQTSEFSECFEVVDGLPAAGTWVGEQTIGGGVIPGDDAFLAAGSGAPAGPAQFTYGANDGDPNGGAGSPSSEWIFYTTAQAAGTIDIPWRWAGFHGFAGVTVGLEAFVVRDGDDVVFTESLVNAGPQSCDPCIEPSGGFDYDGDVSFPVLAGDIYGFTITGSNSDSNASLRGQLVLGTELPTSCADAQNLYSTSTDGRYLILPTGGQRFSVHCEDMNESAIDYLELHVERIGGGYNFSSYAAGGAATGTTVTTTFEKVRFDPSTLLVDIADRAFSTSTGALTHPDSTFGNQSVSSMPYATAMACSDSDAADGTANVNLDGTPFAVDDTWSPVGAFPTGSATINGTETDVAITANGFCGWRQPDPSIEPLYPFGMTGARFVLQLRYATDAPPVALATPTVFASISRSATSVDLFALVDGAENTPLTVDVRRSASCTNGVLGASSLVATLSDTSDAEGYIELTGINGVASGDYVAITVTAPSVTAASLCVRTTGDNDYWPKALSLGSASTVTTSDVIEVAGRSRWYRFPIVPDQRLTVNLSNLPADYDLAVFKDIAKEFEAQLVPASAAELTELSAEFAPSVFSPSVFSPSVFSPSVFSPDAYADSVMAPSVFSPSVFSPSVFSPSVFSPSVFSPSVFSPSVFSPSVFSPSVFSPSVFSPSVFSPSVFSPEEIAQAFSSAQTRSLVAVSASAGTGPESVVVNTWNNTGFFYVRVSGRGGAFDPDDLFSVTVSKSFSSCSTVTDTTLTPRATKSDAGDYRTVIVTDSSKLALGNGSASSLLGKLNAFKARPEVDGVLVDIAGDTRIGQLRTQVTNNIGCPFAVNLLAEEIKSIVDSYRAPSGAETLRYVTIVGDDTVIPFFRYPDQSRLGQESGYRPPVTSNTISEASLRRDFVLSQDAYGSGVSVDIRTNSFPVPGLAVGRLVETPSEISGLLDAYTGTNGVVAPASSLVTGYDFLADAADAVSDELAAGTGNPVNDLITDSDVSPQKVLPVAGDGPRDVSWTADDLRDELLTSRHDMIFLAGHFSANSALAADYETNVITTELAAAPLDHFKNAIVFSAGCHSGYNLVDGEALAGASLPLDWAQAFAQEQAVLIAGTGYQYGDTEFIEYSERLYRDFARELRAGAAGTTVSVGEALANAKRTYIATTPDIRGIHEKAVLEATLFGLPMFGVNMPAGRGAAPGGGATVFPDEILTEPFDDLGLATKPFSVATGAELSALQTLTLDVISSAGVISTVVAEWLEGPAGVVTNPAEPAIPKLVKGVTSDLPGQVLRGVGWRGGTYDDDANVLPLTGAPTTELRGVHAPFLSPVFYPMKLWTPNYFGALSGTGGTNLIITPVQHKADDGNPGKSIRRTFTNLDLKLYYSSNLTSLALSDAPSIVKVSTALSGSDLQFTAQVVGDPKVAMHEVWIVWTDGNGVWQPLDLEQDPTDSRLWTGTLLAAPSNIQFVAQAANGLGLVAFDDNLGRYYSAAGAAAPTGTTLTLITPVPSSGQYGDNALVTAELKAGSVPLSGKLVTVSIGGASASGHTAANGRVTVAVPLSSLPGGTRVVARFEGDQAHVASGADASFTISKGVLELTLSVPPTTVVGGSATAVATLTGPAGPLPQTSVAFIVTRPAPASPILFERKTDLAGTATLDLPTNVAGNYQVEVRYGSIVTVGSIVLDLTDPLYVAVAANAPFTIRAQGYAFSSTRDGNFEIYTMNPDGTGQTRRTNNNAIDVEPSWSPDGSKIVFASSRTGNGDIYKMNADGTGLVRLTTHTAIEGAPAWSPDGTKIAFTSRRDGNFEIYVMNADGTGQTRRTTNNAIDNEPEWSPDGTKLSFTSTRTGTSDIYVMNANGTGVTRLTTSTAIDGTSAWSPDGTKIAFSSRRDGNFEIYVMNANGSSQTRRTTNNAIDIEPAWSIDGTRIAFASARTGLGDIYAMNPNGTGVTRLTTSLGIDSSPATR